MDQKTLSEFSEWIRQFSEKELEELKTCIERRIEELKSKRNTYQIEITVSKVFEMKAKTPEDAKELAKEQSSFFSL